MPSQSPASNLAAPTTLRSTSAPSPTPAATSAPTITPAPFSTHKSISDPGAALTVRATPTLSPAPTPVTTVPLNTPTPAPSPTPVATVPKITPAPSPTQKPASEWEFHTVTADESKVVVDLRVFAGIDVRVTLDGHEPDEILHIDGILRHIFQPVEPGKHSVQVKDVTGSSGSREIEVEVPSPTTPPTTDSTVSPTPKPTVVATPKPTPSLTPEEAAHAALSQMLPWYHDPPYP